MKTLILATLLAQAEVDLAPTPPQSPQVDSTLTLFDPSSLLLSPSFSRTFTALKQRDPKQIQLLLLKEQKRNKDQSKHYLTAEQTQNLYIRQEKRDNKKIQIKKHQKEKRVSPVQTQKYQDRNFSTLQKLEAQKMRHHSQKEALRKYER